MNAAAGKTAVIIFLPEQVFALPIFICSVGQKISYKITSYSHSLFSVRLRKYNAFSYISMSIAYLHIDADRSSALIRLSGYAIYVT